MESRPRLFGVIWRHRSRDHSTRGGRLSVGGPCDQASISHRYGDIATQKLDRRMHRWTLRWFYALSNAMHCIGQTKTTPANNEGYLLILMQKDFSSISTDIQWLTTVSNVGNDLLWYVIRHLHLRHKPRMRNKWQYAYTATTKIPLSVSVHKCRATIMLRLARNTAKMPHDQRSLLYV